MILAKKIIQFVRSKSRLIKIFFIVVLFAVLFWIVPIPRVVNTLLMVNLTYLLIGLGVSFLSTILSAAELEPLVRNQGIRRSMTQILGINLAVKFYSQFMPGSIVGSVLRWYRLSQPDGKAPEALAAIAFFRLLELFLDISLGVIFLLASQQSLVEMNIIWPLLLIVGVPILWILLTRLSLPGYIWIEERTRIIWQRPILNRIAAWMETFFQAVSTFARTPVRDLLISILAGVFSLLFGVTSNYFLAMAVGIDLPYLTIGWVYALLVLATQLPFAFAGGLGIREVTLLAILPSLGSTAEQALAFSFLLFLRGLSISFVGGISEAISVFLLRQNPDLDAVRQKAVKS